MGLAGLTLDHLDHLVHLHQDEDQVTEMRTAMLCAWLEEDEEQDMTGEVLCLEIMGLKVIFGLGLN